MHEDFTKSMRDIFLSVKKGREILMRGSEESAHRAAEVVTLLKRCIVYGDDLRFRTREEFYNSFVDGRCIYAVDEYDQLIGFCFIKKAEFLGQPYVSRCSLMIEPSLRDRGLGIKIAYAIFDLVEKKYPQHDILSRSSNPTVWKLNFKTGFTEITYRELWEFYGINMIEECENYSHLICSYKRHPSSNNIFDNIELIDTESLRPKKIFVWKWQEHSLPANHSLRKSRWMTFL